MPPGCFRTKGYILGPIDFGENLKYHYLVITIIRPGILNCAVVLIK